MAGSCSWANFAECRHIILKEPTGRKMKTLCMIYKSPNEEEAYLYVKKEDDLSRVPPELLSHFGTPRYVTTLALDQKRKLARVRSENVLSSLEEKGYYLQLSPPKEAYMQAVNQHNHKLA